MSNQIEGRNPVLEALRAGRSMNKILISNDVERHSAIAEILHLAKERKVPVEWLSPEILKTKSSTRSPQGVIAYVSAKDYLDIHDLLNISKNKGESAFYVMLDGLEDPHNLGAIIRTADASGVHGVIIPQRRAVGLTVTVATSTITGVCGAALGTRPLVILGQAPRAQGNRDTASTCARSVRGTPCRRCRAPRNR